MMVLSVPILVYVRFSNVICIWFNEFISTKPNKEVLRFLFFLCLEKPFTRPNNSIAEWVCNMNAFYHLFTTSTTPSLSVLRSLYEQRNFFIEWIMEIDFGILFFFIYIIIFIRASTKSMARWTLFFKLKPEQYSIIIDIVVDRSHENMENGLYRIWFIHNHQYEWREQKKPMSFWK